MSPMRQITGPSLEGHSGIKSDQYCLAYQAHKNLVKLVWPNIAWCTKLTIHLFASSVVGCYYLYIFSPSTSWCTLALLLYYRRWWAYCSTYQLVLFTVFSFLLLILFLFSFFFATCFLRILSLFRSCFFCVFSSYFTFSFLVTTLVIILQIFLLVFLIFFIFFNFSIPFSYSFPHVLSLVSNFGYFILYNIHIIYFLLFMCFLNYVHNGQTDINI